MVVLFECGSIKDPSMGIDKTGSGEFLLLYYKIQGTGTTKEVTLPVPSNRPCAESDYVVLPF
jgi:hypothetical protein